jgi:hypothetical protein
VLSKKDSKKSAEFEIFMLKQKPPAISRLADGLPPKGGLIQRYLAIYLKAEI